MPCFHPIPALQDGRKIHLHPKPKETANIGLPCGACLGCKTARSQEWGARAMHEARDHSESIFATLTYDPKHHPADGQLVPEHLTLFLKRLRQAMARSRNRAAIRGDRLRYLACGEYGDTTARPHYHAILFGVGFDDATVARRGDLPLWQSETLNRLWGKGHVYYGEVTHASAAYVAGYTMKSMGKSHCDPDGVVMQAPFMRVSTKPGLGAFYAARYAGDFRAGTLVSGGTASRLPRYYKKLLERDNADIAEEAAFNVYTQQRERQQRDSERNSPHRLVAAEAIAKAKQRLTRSHSL